MFPWWQLSRCDRIWTRKLFLLLTVSGPVNQHSTSEGNGTALNESQFSGSSEQTALRVEALQISFFFLHRSRNRTKKRHGWEQNTDGNDAVLRTTRGRCKEEIHLPQWTVTRSRHVFSNCSTPLFFFTDVWKWWWWRSKKWNNTQHDGGMWFFQIFLYRFQAHGSICRNKLKVLVCSSLFLFAPVLLTYKVVFFGPQRGGFHPPPYSQSSNQDADLLVSDAKLLVIGSDRRYLLLQY